jgi:hypothetical protein
VDTGIRISKVCGLQIGDVQERQVRVFDKGHGEVLSAAEGVPQSFARDDQITGSGGLPQEYALQTHSSHPAYINGARLQQVCQKGL